MSEKDFHVDRRVDSSGTPERQLTMTMPAQISDYVAGKHRFELSTPSGARHEMFYSATVARAGANLHLRVRLTTAAAPLPFPLRFQEQAHRPAPAGREPRGNVPRRPRTTNARESRAS